MVTSPLPDAVDDPPSGDGAPLARVISEESIILVGGSGGVGKTTTSAALALAAAITGRKVLVLTVDPARRLADALGVGAFGNEIVQVSPDILTSLGAEAGGELSAAMLDTKASWDEVINRQAPDQQTAEKILANPLYRNVTARFVQSHDYVAIERLRELAVSDEYDLIVVDTPPSRHAVDFLDAPERMADFFSSRFLRLIIAPDRAALMRVASRPFYAIAERVLGGTFLADIAEFFLLFEQMYDGFVERADEIGRLLVAPTTSFVVVATAEAGPAREALNLLGDLDKRRLRVGGVVVNRVVPPGLLLESGEAAERLSSLSDDDRAQLLATLDIGDQGGPSVKGSTSGAERALTRVLSEVANGSELLRELAADQQTWRDLLGANRRDVGVVPELGSDVTDLEALGVIADALVSGSTEGSRTDG